nr:MAG TPA: hypothetical protein [Caudoviricetes sp.]
MILGFWLLLYWSQYYHSVGLRLLSGSFIVYCNL